MKFTSDSAKVKHNGGMSKDDLAQGYEVVDPYADDKAFAWSRQCPEMQGWRNPPRPMDEMYVMVEDD